MQAGGYTGCRRRPLFEADGRRRRGHMSASWPIAARSPRRRSASTEAASSSIPVTGLSLSSAAWSARCAARLTCSGLSGSATRPCRRTAASSSASASILGTSSSHRTTSTATASMSPGALRTLPARWYLHLRRYLAAGAGSDCGRVRRPRRTAAKEHRRSGAYIRRLPAG
jgi:hypothetical protein